MVPAKGRLVDFGKSESATLVGVGDVGEVIMEVVESVVPACCFGSHVVYGSERCQCWAFCVKRRQEFVDMRTNSWTRPGQYKIYRP
jgi:hypothetical protein